jgi:predicted amidohydrolase
MADNLRISMVQSHIIWEDRDENLGYYGELLRRVSGKTDIAVLPETFTTGFSMDVEKLADTVDGPTIPTIKGWAKKYKLAVAGSFIAKEGGKYFNRAFFVTPEGETYLYDKRHLFRMAGEDQHFTAGDKRTIDIRPHQRPAAADDHMVILHEIARRDDQVIVSVPLVDGTVEFLMVN